MLTCLLQEGRWTALGTMEPIPEGPSSSGQTLTSWRLGVRGPSFHLRVLEQSPGILCLLNNQLDSEFQSTTLPSDSLGTKMKRFLFLSLDSGLQGKRDVNTVGNFLQGCSECPQHLQGTELCQGKGTIL